MKTASNCARGLVTGITLTALALLLALGSPAAVQSASPFDYSGQKMGIGSDLGLALFSMDIGAAFQWGATMKIQLHEGFHLEPGVHMAVKSGGWDLNFAPTPMYQFRFRKFPIHPYATFGPAVHIQHATIDNKGYTKGRFALHWGGGAEWLITPQFSIFNDYKYMLVLGSPAPDIFTLTVGGYFYFDM